MANSQKSLYWHRPSALLRHVGLVTWSPLFAQRLRLIPASDFILDFYQPAPMAEPLSEEKLREAVVELESADGNGAEFMRYTLGLMLDDSHKLQDEPLDFAVAVNWLLFLFFAACIDQQMDQMLYCNSMFSHTVGAPCLTDIGMGGFGNRPSVRIIESFNLLTCGKVSSTTAQLWWKPSGRLFRWLRAMQVFRHPDAPWFWCFLVVFFVATQTSQLQVELLLLD